MNREVQTVKSKISLFDKGLAKNLLKRYWPLWTSYSAFLIILLSSSIYSPYYAGTARFYVNGNILTSGIGIVYFSFIISALSALAVFSFMYSSRSCALICSMPVRRESVFLTACAVGLLPLLAADVLAFSVGALMTLGDSYIELRYLAQWLAMAVMSNTAFFGMAVFCAMLTGNLPTMPCVYLVLNVAVYIAESAIKMLFSIFIYGFSYGKYTLTWLSPIVQIVKSLTVDGGYFKTVNGVTAEIPVPYTVDGLGYLMAYCAAGIVLLGLALLLYRRRRMETAGDVVAVSVLKPVFKYCMTFGGAIVFACCMNEWVFRDSLSAFPEAAIATLMLLIGAFIGYFAAQMLIDKSLNVFRANIKGYALSCCVLIAVAAVCEFDVFGYERWTPESDEVESISLTGLINVSGDIQEPENIQAFVDMHRQIIAHKPQNENAHTTYSIPINYYLKDGRTVSRNYQVDCSIEALNGPESELMLWQDICNSEEVTYYRTSFAIPVTAHSLGLCSIESYSVDGEGRYEGESFTLTTLQALELYNECMLPDIEDGNMGHFWAMQYDDFFDVKSNTTIHIELIDRDYKNGSNGQRYYSIEFNVQMNSARTIEWIEKNAGINPVSLRVTDPQMYYDDYISPNYMN